MTLSTTGRVEVSKQRKAVVYRSQHVDGGQLRTVAKSLSAIAEHHAYGRVYLDPTAAIDSPDFVILERSGRYYTRLLCGLRMRDRAR
jgi:hypothetical protein